MTVGAYMRDLSWWYAMKINSVVVTVNLHVFPVELGTLSTEHPQIQQNPPHTTQHTIVCLFIPCHTPYSPCTELLVGPGTFSTGVSTGDPQIHQNPHTYHLTYP